MAERAVIYARSAVADDRAVILQVQWCRMWCEKHDVTVVDVIVDNGVSGVGGRRSFAQLKADLLVVYDVARLARSTHDLLRIRGDLWAADVRLVIVQRTRAPRFTGWPPGRETQDELRSDRPPR